jgi:hypothetical protein
MHELIFDKKHTRIFNDAIKVVENTCDWYMDESTTYIKNYGATKVPHAIHKHVPNKLVIREIVYQTIHGKFSKSMYAIRKKLY